MLKRFTIQTIALILISIFAIGTSYAECNCICDYDPEQCHSRVTTRVRNGKMKVKEKWNRIYLYEKDPLTWDVIGRGGAWGFLDYRPQGTDFKFLFVGRKLQPAVDYTLIYYPDPWPGDGLICLGSGVADEYGKVKIVGRGDPLNPYYSAPVNTGNLPADYDANVDHGAKIWLVLSSDLDCGGVTTNTGNPQMIGWNPSEYLFENTLITFVDTDTP